MEKAVATHSSTLAWKNPWTEEPGRLQSMGLHRVRHDWVTSLSLFTFMHWRRKWQPTPVFLLRESQGRGSLVGSMGSHRVRHDWSDLAAAAVLFSLNSVWCVFDANSQSFCWCYSNNFGFTKHQKFSQDSWDQHFLNYLHIDGVSFINNWKSF